MSSSNNVIDITPFLEKKRLHETLMTAIAEYFRDQYGTCELCGKDGFRQNGACLDCIKYWGL